MNKNMILVLVIILGISLIGVTGAMADRAIPSTAYGGQGADGHRVIMWNYKSAGNPTYAKLVEALKNDKTDARIYGIKTFKCTDYAESVHNNLEKQGIRTGIASIKFTVGNGHAVNVVKTTDKGTIYIDCCGTEGKPGQDAVAKIVTGQKYVICPIDGSKCIGKLNIIKSVVVYW